MTSETRSRTTLKTGSSFSFRPLWLLLFLATAPQGTTVHAATADLSRSGHHVAPLPACCPRAVLGLGDSVTFVDTDVCLTSSSSSATAGAVASTAQLNNSRTRRQPTEKDGDDQVPVGLGHDDNTARQAGNSVPAPWVKGSCKRGSTPTKGRPKGAQGASTEYCVYTHPLFNQGMGLSVVTTSKRINTMAARPVFGSDEDGILSKGSTHTSTSWPSDSSQVAIPAWIEQSIPGKDVGLLATRPIRRGERIMSRTPAVMIDGASVDALSVAAFSSMLHDAASSLPAPHRAQFFNLSTNYGSDGTDSNQNEAYQIFATNAFRTGIADGEPDLHTVFRDVSRLNHGCQPNCAYFFDPVTLTHNIYAVVDIMQGEELTVAYIDPIQKHAERKAKLHRHWGFECTCARCAQPPHRQTESDDRVRSIQTLITSLDNYGISIPVSDSADSKGNTTVGPAAGELLVLLFELEGLHARMHEAEYRLALEWNGVGDALRATQAARRCLDRGLLVRGPDQPFLASMRALIADPTIHWSWRFRIGKGKEHGGGEI